MEVITLNNRTFLEKCHELYDKLDFHPDLVVGILNGGGYVVDVYEGVPLELIKLQRDNYIKSNSLIRLILKYLPYSVSNQLRKIESKKAKESINNIDLDKLEYRMVDFQFNSNSKEKPENILVVDDAVDTGKTMFVIKNSLSKLFPKAEIKTAVISWTIETSIVKPDYYLFKNILVRFPWSKDYKGKDFEKKSFSS